MDANEQQVANPTTKRPTGPLKRIDEGKFESVRHQFANTAFESKNEGYGAWSNAKLNDKQGASFIKEKNKMKKRNSHASGNFNMSAVNSIKFD